MPGLRVLAKILLFIGLSDWSFQAGLPCPSHCNRQGNCINRVCECYDGFYGGDCSLRECPKGKAWTDLATDTDEAHAEVECSNMGLCDTDTGQCVCRDGFEGQACERITCPNDCSGNGACQSMKYYASLKNPGLGATSTTQDYVYIYETQWDAEMMMGCACDDGWFGYDCSLRHCPTGDDPLTGTAFDPDGLEYNEQQKLKCTANGGYFTLSFRGETTARLQNDASPDDMEEALKALSSVTDEGVTVEGADPVCSFTGATTFVTFTQDFGDVPLLWPDTTALTHTSAAYSPQVVVTEYRTGTKEDEYCSNRGICDTETGLCACNTDWDTSNGYGKQGTRGDCGYATDTITSCPGEIACSVQGVCSGSPTYTCTCSSGWQGSDCSERTCSYARSWFDYPSDDEEAHLDKAECSDMGACDREEGLCTCADNFSGSACQYMACPGADEDNACNGQGQCLSMAALAKLATVNGVLQSYTYGSTPNKASTWDYDKMYGCYCDDGYAGYDCSLFTCPYGDDPLTHDEVNEIQAVTCQGDSGEFYLTFREEITSALPYYSTASDVEDALHELSTVEIVEVTSDETSVCTSDGNTFYVEFWMPSSDVPLLEATNDGLDGLSVSEYQKGTKEYAECSNRGICDTTSGDCDCFEGMGSSDGKGDVGNRGDCGYVLPFLVSSSS
uniref:EGF-like domain-containing protein n=1 Tax=Heterosigma akashiwo TaxID=2829 RepID=A0A6V1QSW3_HETAK|mmetsp:Transcript_31246/g.51010  ORF Transcript_31246/g.51010 Transcript_31246/m.51010 type:complete len:673 (+) Transcript_31246:80-2098(+)